MAEGDDGAEGRVHRHADDDFAGMGPDHHGLHGDAVDARLRPQRARPCQDVLGGRSHRLGGGQAKPHPVHVRFVADVARVDLDRATPAISQDVAGDRSRLPPVRGEAHRHGRHAVGAQRLPVFDRRQPAPSLRQRRADRGGSHMAFGQDRFGQGRMNAEERRAPAPRLDQMHDAARGGGFGVVAGNARLMKALTHAIVRTEPHAENRRRVAGLRPVRLHRVDHRLGGGGGAGQRGRAVHRQDGVAAGFSKQRLHRGRVAGRRRVADDVDGVGL